MNLANLFVRAARAHGDLPAVALGPDVLLSYAQLVRRGAAWSSRGDCARRSVSRRATASPWS